MCMKICVFQDSSLDMACIRQYEWVPTISCKVRFPFLSSYCICIFKEIQKITSPVFSMRVVNRLLRHQKLHFMKNTKLPFMAKTPPFTKNKWNSTFTAFKNQIMSLLNTCAMKVKKILFSFLNEKVDLRIIAYVFK